VGFALHVDGTAYSGWLAASVTRAIDQAADTFACTVTEGWSGAKQKWPIRPGQKCEIHLDGVLAMTGYIDSYEPSYDAESHTVSISGRSAAADIIDGSAPVGQLKNMTVGQIAEVMAKPFGIRVDSANAPPTIIEDVQVNPGETIHELLDRLAQTVPAVRAVLLGSAPDGSLSFIRVGGGGSASTPLQQGVNIWKASAILNDAERYSSVTVLAQHSNADDRSDEEAEVEIPDEGEEPATAPVGGGPAGVTTTAVTATVKDPAVKRYRPLIITGDSELDQAGAQRQAEIEVRRRTAQATKCTAQVVGWHQSGPDSPLWGPNLLVDVDSPFLGIKRQMVISSCTYEISEAGSTCTLELALTGAFEADPPDAVKPEKVETPSTEFPDDADAVDPDAGDAAWGPIDIGPSKRTDYVTK
jgi:prophage tail gpP-like protein